ncbi:MalY/PatB family protein [Brevibacillus centrosporus]|uniref:cysteine-S-conjugate beta-lyase n=1 Tax=Brevibacillus centrosporus TaxID=54910 RepID=A0A1I3R7F4_9BACL|nr:MalY/PatB family protein [Brevibacillus centrosporus]MEC2129632.1 pyridoxal phosphate-dependent aminotransferase [Brevibacillus centrosporus]MED4909060.1 pyridoxal phosphate-dependent aminotransferase [Brevibacillus centrosporus]RNB65766.1 pyridoxal phosphate-dependent aminotransferase [Brevibacillus centrosporus]SFJ41351.1 cystathione beta-lyase [Brevibacillus centrosporus]GED29990.1 cystathionine beta-lyase [Brevibacillus centrosporus]
MRYDFDKVINRLNTASVKWDEVDRIFGDKDLLPLWVADMDFQVPAPVTDALRARVEHGIFGYTERPESYYEAVIGWMERRHQWSVQKEWICHCPGVVPALSYLVQVFTQPGDKVIIQPPVYHPFTSVVADNGREVVHNPLKYEEGRYFMDFEDLRQKMDPSVKLLILCNPHNPGGRVWTKEELTELGNICLENNVMVISDEIHGDLILKGHKHIPFAAISEEFAQNSIICTAPSKTFNMAGMQTSNIIIPNQEYREAFQKMMSTLVLRMTNTFGVVATEAAYRHGDEWLDQLLVYLQGNLDFLTEYIETHIKGIKVIQPEGTYLVWLDCRELGMDTKGLQEFMGKQAKVAVNQGHVFGPGGEQFIRLNMACPRSLIEEGLERIAKAVSSCRSVAN